MFLNLIYFSEIGCQEGYNEFGKVISLNYSIFVIASWISWSKIFHLIWRQVEQQVLIFGKCLNCMHIRSYMVLFIWKLWIIWYCAHLSCRQSIILLRCLITFLIEWGIWNIKNFLYSFLFLIKSRRKWNSFKLCSKKYFQLISFCSNE